MSGNNKRLHDPEDNNPLKTKGKDKRKFFDNYEDYEVDEFWEPIDDLVFDEDVEQYDIEDWFKNN